MQNFFYYDEIEAKGAGEGIMRKILAHDNELMVCRLHFDKGAVGAPHKHPHTQCAYVLSGEFEFDIAGDKQVVKAGDTVYIRSELIHGCVCLAEGELLDIFTPERKDFLS